MNIPSRIPRHPRAFTLVEILVVIGIMAIILTVSIPAIGGMGGGRFSQAVSQVTGTLNEAHAYAVAQNTYVWVAFYTNAPSTSSPNGLYFAAYASNDGTDPINWDAVTVGPDLPYTVNSTTLSPIGRMRGAGATQIAPVATTYRNPPNPSADVPADPAVSPVFRASLVAGGSRTILSSVAVVQFTPSGGARISASPVGAVGVGLQPLKGAGVPDADNMATVWISGLTGLITVYRK